MVAREAHNLEVTGSNPVPATGVFFMKIDLSIDSVANCLPYLRVTIHKVIINEEINMIIVGFWKQ